MTQKRIIFEKEKRIYCVSGARVRRTGRTGGVHAIGRPRSIRSKSDGRDQSGPRRLTREGDDGARADVSDDITDGGGGSAARHRMLAGERQHDDANEGHRGEADGTANLPATKTTAEKQRTAPATRRKRRGSSGRRRRRCSGGLRRRRRGGRGRRRDGEHDGGLPERRRRLKRRRRTAGAAAATAKLGRTALGLFRRREAKARVATGRGDTGGPFKGARRRRQRPTAAGDEEGKIGKNESETNSNPTLSKTI